MGSWHVQALVDGYAPTSSNDSTLALQPIQMHRRKGIEGEAHGMVVEKWLSMSTSSK